MVDFAIVLIGVMCFVSVYLAHNVIVGSAAQTVDSDPESELRERLFTRFMKVNMAFGALAIFLVLLNAEPGQDPLMSASVEAVVLDSSQ